MGVTAAMIRDFARITAAVKNIHQHGCNGTDHCSSEEY
jgi:hypothetical protein